VLRVLGFGVTMLAARVRFQATRVLPRTHMLLAVETGAGRQLADVGFGGGGPLLPIPLAAGAVSTQYLWHYRLVPEGSGFILQAGHGTGFADLYAFSLEPFVDADFEMANFYVSRHPASRFVRALAVRLPTPAAQHLLRNREYCIDTGAGPVPQARLDDAGIVRVLADVFGIEVAAGTSFPLEPA
jgi:N-hydroxyarylamine O-acetyltransferase